MQYKRFDPINRLDHKLGLAHLFPNDNVGMVERDIFRFEFW